MASCASNNWLLNRRIKAAFKALVLERSFNSWSVGGKNKTKGWFSWGGYVWTDNFVGCTELGEVSFMSLLYLVLALLALDFTPSGFWMYSGIAGQHRFVHESFLKPSGRIDYFFCGLLKWLVSDSTTAFVMCYKSLSPIKLCIAWVHGLCLHYFYIFSAAHVGDE